MSEVMYPTIGNGQQIIVNTEYAIIWYDVTNNNTLVEWNCVPF